jgi:cell shape-determining protein MreD
MIRRITGIILGVLAFLLVYALSGGMATPSNPNWALALLVGLVVALIWPWLFGLFMVRRVRQKRQDEIDAEVQKQLAQQQNKQG